MNLTENEIKILIKCIDTEIGFTCHNIASRATMKVDNEDYRKYLDNLTKEDKKYLGQLTELQNKIKGDFKNE